MSFVALGGRVFLASSEGESHASLPFVHTIKIFQQKLEYFFVLPKGISRAHFVRFHENLRVFVGFPPQEKTHVFSLSCSLPFVHTIKIFQQKLEYFFVLPKGIEPLSSGSKPDILSVELQEQYGCVDWWVARDSNPGPYP